MASALQKIINSGSIEDKARFIIANNSNYMQGKSIYSQKTINKIFATCIEDKDKLLLDKYLDFAAIVSNFRFQLYSIQRNIKCNVLVLDNLFEKWVFLLDLLRGLNGSTQEVKSQVMAFIKKQPNYEDYFNLNSDGVLFLTEATKGTNYLDVITNLKNSIYSDYKIAKGWITAIETAAENKGCKGMIPPDIAGIINEIKKQGPGNKMMNSDKETAFKKKYGDLTKDIELFRAFAVFPCYEKIEYNPDCFQDAMLYFKDIN